MAKRNVRKPSGAARIAVIGDEAEHETHELARESNGTQTDSEAIVAKPERKVKAKTEQQSNGHYGVSDIKKAAAFANSIGGLDKAVAVLQILKVAKEVQ